MVFAALAMAKDAGEIIGLSSMTTGSSFFLAVRFFACGFLVSVSFGSFALRICNGTGGFRSIGLTEDVSLSLSAFLPNMQKIGL